MKSHNLPHVGKMTQSKVELTDGRMAIVDYRLTTTSDNTVMACILGGKGVGSFQPIKLSKIKKQVK